MRSVCVCVLLTAATLVVYGQALDFGFVHYDDLQYVVENAQIRTGLTMEGVRWALTSPHGHSWHPLTGLSHMLDCELYGLEPAGHHATNVVLHILNTLLLFGLLQSMTRAVWRSAFVAALFALHPLHVESVAWISERKDLLSTLFGLLTMVAWAAYARRGGAWRYGLAAILFGLALMAKPMLVTLPLVLLLLDVWPLGRWPSRSGGRVGTGAQGKRRSVRFLLLEKVPLLALSAAASVATLVFQESTGALGPAARVSAVERMANAVVSYVKYLGKTVWPNDLAVLYPHPYLPGGTPFHAWQIAGCAALLIAVTVLVFRLKQQPWARVAWLWYLGTLVPVIGLVQVGVQAMADRYTYLPLVGVFIMVAWGAAELVARGRDGARLARPAATAVALAVLLSLTVSARAQARHWRDSVSLFRHCLAVAPGSARIHTNLGIVLASRGRQDEAMWHYRQAMDIEPDLADAHINLGNELLSRKDIAGAARHYRLALQSAPDSAIVHFDLGLALSYGGEFEEAIRHYREALRLRPGFVQARESLALARRLQVERDRAEDGAGDSLPPPRSRER